MTVDEAFRLITLQINSILIPFYFNSRIIWLEVIYDKAFEYNDYTITKTWRKYRADP